jgi:tRNA threonylcarbamoyl adenosine modification protein (Sua5/YciO/YrdC/YwlC family)
MIKYVIEQNPDDRILKAASDILATGGLVSLPTDTNWVAVADPFSKAGVEKLYKLKKEEPKKHFSVLCDTISRATDFALIGDNAFRLIRGKVPGNYTFIFNAQKLITKALKASKRDHQIGVRFPPSNLAQKLIETHGQLLLSTNLTHEMMGIADKEIDIYGFLIDDSLSHMIDMVLDPGEIEFAGGSTIVSLVDETDPVLLREGAGEWP